MAVLSSIGKKQSEHQDNEDPANSFINIICSALSSGHAHLAGVDNNAPDEDLGDLGSLGWRGTKEHLIPQGDMIGWIDKHGIYLNGESAFTVVQKIASYQHNNIPVSAPMLWKSLKAKGFLATYEKGKCTRKKTIAGKRELSLLHIRAGVLNFIGTIGTIGTDCNNPTENTGSYDCTDSGNPESETGTIGTLDLTSTDEQKNCTDFVYRFSDDNSEIGTQKDELNQREVPIVPIVPTKNDRGSSGKKCFSCKSFIHSNSVCKDITKKTGKEAKIESPDTYSCIYYQALEN